MNHRISTPWSIPYIILILILLIPGGVAVAQDDQVDGPVYIVEEGDTLWSIALRFRVSMDDLLRVNGITDANQITLGSRIIIPGLEGIQGVLTTQLLPYGENLHSLSRHYQVPIETLVKLNHLSTSTELYAGSTLVVPENEDGAQQTLRAMLSPGQSLLEMAITKESNPWSFQLDNQLAGSWAALPGDVLHLTTGSLQDETTNEPGALPQEFQSIALKPELFVQGKVAVVNVDASPGMDLSGTLNGRQFEFFIDENGDYVALQGIHAMADTGLSTLVLTATLPVETYPPEVPFTYSQSVLIRSGGYSLDPVLVVSPETIDPAVTAPEDAQWTALATPKSPDKLWQGQFISPAPEPFSDCWPSFFGSRRSYNGSAYEYFHTGLDFCGGVGIEILAPAAGVVVFAGPLTVRGNATMIDHGWGIYTGYMHQSEIMVEVGDHVEPGQVIGLVGGTGRVTGPHLHWEVWAGGVQVDPMDWLEQSFP